MLNDTIERVTTEKLLVVRIDRNLTFDNHVDDSSKKLAQSWIGVLESIKTGELPPLELRG